MRRASVIARQVGGFGFRDGSHSALSSTRTALRTFSTSSAANAEEGSLVRVEHGPGAVSKMTLCRAKKLNSLSLPMIGELKRGFSDLKKAGARAVLLRGEGRALCAGGDVAEVRQAVLDNNPATAEFFYQEYELDYQIASLYEREGILQISLWDGIVMGGGVGLSVHGPIRIATEKTLFAMPETGIGLFPDVGLTWALSRLKAGAHIGIFLGTTGTRLTAADCVWSGLATHYCPSDRLGALEERLQKLGDQAADLEAVSAAIAATAGGDKPDTSKAVLAPNAEALARCFGDSVTTAEEIVARLEKEGSEWAKGVLATLRQRSPTSVKIALEAIRRHRNASLKEAFITEYRLSQWCMRTQPHSDFCEGIRAVLVDKDNKPKWDPPTLEDVSKLRVDGFFAPLPSSHPLGELKI